MRDGKKYYKNTITAKQGIYNNYRLNAKRRRIAWEIDYFDFYACIREPCHYCGLEYSLLVQTNEGGYYYNGVDRVDNRRGYVSDNIVPCCKHCNRAKGTLSEHEFLTLVERIYKKQRGVKKMNVYVCMSYGKEYIVCAETVEEARILLEDKGIVHYYDLKEIKLEKGVLLSKELHQG